MVSKSVEAFVPFLPFFPFFPFLPFLPVLPFLPSVPFVPFVPFVRLLHETIELLNGTSEHGDVVESPRIQWQDVKMSKWNEA